MEMLRRIVLACVFVIPGVVPAQPIGVPGVGCRVTHLAPAGSIGDLFKPAYALELSAGAKTESDMRWDGVAEFARFAKPNTDALYHKDLSLAIAIYGVGVRSTYLIAGSEGLLGGTIIPTVSGTAMIHRWAYDRGAYVTDTTANVRLEALSLRDWSLGLQASVGIEIPVGGFIDLSIQAGYRIIIGEIWPTLALRLEGASGFQMAELSAGLRWTF